MENNNNHNIAEALSVSLHQIEQVLALTAQGNTIPFIARYRKEVTGNLDEVVIKSIIDMDKSLTTLNERKATILAKIEEQGKLTDQLRTSIEATENSLIWKSCTCLIRKNAVQKRRLRVKQACSH